MGARKLQQHFVGPITALEHIGSQAYRLQLPAPLQKLHNICHVSLLKSNVAGDDGVEQPQPIVVDGELEWQFKAILWHRCCCSVQQYLVKYAGYDQSEAIQLDEADLVNAPDILIDYKAHMW